MRRLSTAARMRAPKLVRSKPYQSTGDQHGADRDDEDTIGGKGAEAEIELAVEIARHFDRLRQRPVDEGVAGDRHEDEADGEQHLVELVGRVEAAVEQALEGDTPRPHQHERRREGERERHAIPCRQAHGHVAPRHGEGAVRQIDEPHQPHGDREAHGDDEEDHGVSQAVEEDAYADVGEVLHRATCPSLGTESAAVPAHGGVPLTFA